MKFLKIILLLLIIFSLFGCGDELGGDVGTLSTVMVSAKVSPVEYKSDVADWQDKDGDGICEYNYLVNDDDPVTVTVSVDPLPNLPEGVEPSEVVIDRVKISYTPADSDTSALQEKFISLGQNIAAGESIDIPIIIINTQQKGTQPLVSLIGNISLEYRYYVTISLHVIEVRTGDTEEVKTRLTVNVGDYYDDCTL